MNKKELYRKLVEEITIIDINRFNYSDSFRAGEAAGKIKGLESAKKLLNQLYEPELPVIPQFVADIIEKERNKSIPPILYGAYLEARRIPDVFKWVWKNGKNHNTFAIAYITGNYEIEPEPIKTRQVLVKFFDNEEYKTELTEDAARELIEFLEANKNE